MSLQVGFSGSGTGQSYQWRKDGTDLVGATAVTYAIDAATATDAGSYAVTVTNSAGSSVAATQLVVKAASAPVVTTHPANRTVQVGQSAVFSFVATGSYPRLHQWRKDGAVIPGATESTLTLNSVTTTDAGTYSVVLTNPLGSAMSQSAALTVNAATPLVLSTISPSSITNTQGSSSTLFTQVNSGSLPYTYQWFKNGVAVPGAMSSQLRFPSLALADAGTYYVVVTNPAGSVTSREATVTVNPATPITIRASPEPVTVFAGEPASFSVFYSGSLPITLQWLKNGVPISGATGSTHRIAVTSVDDAGNYSAVVGNVLGSVTSAPAALTVRPAVVPTITGQPREATVTENEMASFSVTASGPQPMTYQWYFNGVRIATAADSPQHSFNARLVDAGGYHVVVTNSAGSTQSRTATLTVTPLSPPPSSSITNLTLPAGSSLYIDPNYSPPTYDGTSAGRNWTFQWYQNGEPISGATRGSYQVDSARAEHAGDYFVVVTNPAGSTPSRTSRVRVVPSATPPPEGWVAAERSGDLVYFIFNNPRRMERFNLATEAWLPAIPLNRTASAFVATSGALFLASGSAIYRHAVDGTGETIFSSGFAAEVTGLAVAGDFLLAHFGGSSDRSVSAIRLADGVKVSTANYVYSWGASMAAASNGRIFSRTAQSAPWHIVYSTLQPNGTLASSIVFAEEHAAFPSGRRVFLSPNEAYIADDGGTLFHAATLNFAAGLGGGVDDLAFTNTSRPVVLRGGSVIPFNDQFLEMGRVATGINAARIFLQGGYVFAFGHPTAGGPISLAKLVLSRAVQPLPVAAVDASTAAFTPDETFLDRDGVVYLYSKLHRHIFRWSSALLRYLPPIPLQGWPNCVVYSAANHRIYTGYPDARIQQVRLDAGSLLEEPFAIASRNVLGMAMAGEHLFVIDAWDKSYAPQCLFALDGALKTRRDRGDYSAEYAWDPVLRRLYQFNEGSSSKDLHATEITAAGAFGERILLGFNPAERYPIRIARDGRSALLGSGRIYDTTVPLSVITSLANPIKDATWSGNRLFTGRAATAGPEVQRWSATYALERAKSLAGRALVRLFALSGGRLLVVTFRDESPVFTLLDEDLNELSVTSAVAPTRLVNLAARAFAGRDDQTLIPGFVIAGTQPKRVLIRAAGPALTAFGVSGVLADPRLTIVNQAGAAIATNDDWGGAANLADLLTVTTRVGAFAFAYGSRDAAALLTLDPGAYTVQARGAADTTGVALVEIYDAQDTGSTSKIINIAARTRVGTGSDVLIPGIVIQGEASRTLLIRAVGPGLSAFGVSGVLANPRMRLFRGEQAVAENDDWGQGPGATASEITAASAGAGAFSLQSGSRDSALLVTLSPGAYTAQVSGSDGGSGVALVEVYEVNP